MCGPIESDDLDMIAHVGDRFRVAGFAILVAGCVLLVRGRSSGRNGDREERYGENEVPITPRKLCGTLRHPPASHSAPVVVPAEEQMVRSASDPLLYALTNYAEALMGEPVVINRAPSLRMPTLADFADDDRSISPLLRTEVQSPFRIGTPTLSEGSLDQWWMPDAHTPPPE